MPLKFQPLLDEIDAEIRPQLGAAGTVASYIPALARVPATQFGIALRTFDGQEACAGDARTPFSIQSISKLFTLSLAMQRLGEAEPALVGPWTMGRDKKNPKPLDAPAFHTLVKTASEVLRRHEQQQHAQLNKHLFVGTGSERIRVALQIVPDENNPHALLSARDASGTVLGEARVAPGFRLSAASAEAWIESGYAARPR